MIDKINERLDAALCNLDRESFEELFPLILDDLEYILKDFKNDYNKLSLAEKFEYGFSLTEKKLTYLGKLAKYYFKMIYDIDINIVEDKDYSLSIAGGGYSYKDDTVYYSSFGAMLSSQSELSFLHTCLHEGRHKIQHNVYKITELLSFPPYMLRLLKECLLENSMQGNNREFYTTNYERFFTENDAEIFAKNEIYNFINNMLQMYIKVSNMSLNEMEELFTKVNQINNLIIDNLKKEIFRINPLVEHQIYDGDLVNCDYEISGKFVDRLITLDKYIKSNPQFQEEYPVLKLLFNGNVLKSYEEIMNDKVKLKRGKSLEEQRKIDELYDEIIMLDPILTLIDRLENGDIEFVKEYLLVHPSIISEYPEEISKLNQRYGNFNSRSR